MSGVRGGIKLNMHGTAVQGISRDCDVKDISSKNCVSNKEAQVATRKESRN